MALPNVPPWTVKGVDPRIRARALRYAKIDGSPMGEWLGRAIENQANLQDRNQVLPPDRPEPEPGRPGPPTSAAPSLDYLGDVAAALQALAAAADVGQRRAHVRPPTTLARALIIRPRTPPPIARSARDSASCCSSTGQPGG
jgi:hypothetical protein